MNRMTLLALLLIPALCVAACAKPEPAASAPDAAGEARAAETNAAPRTPFSSPEGYTDPLTITVDASTLVRADGQVLDWDAAAQEAADSAPTAFDASAWPNNEYTAGLPQPSIGSVSMSGEDEEAAGTFSIVLVDMPYDSFLDYVEQIKAAGFTQNARTEDYAAYGMEGMSYGASEASGRMIELIYSGRMAYLLISLN